MAVSWPLPGVHDTHSVSWSEYGATTGVHRILQTLGARGMPATFGISGLVAERHPDAVRAVHDAGHEIAAHSWAQDVMPARLDVGAERENILRCADAFDALVGERPIGWMSPRATGTIDTPDLLTEAGHTWSGDYNDRELPYVLTTSNGPLVCIMHSEFTDVRGAMAGPRAYRDVHRDLIDYLLRAPGPGVLNLTIHAHVGGRPMLADMLDQVLEHIQRKAGDVWIATHRQIADHLLARPVTPEGTHHLP
jgi:peptidoglycan/xylan/chitin deacetylase (PgdA/CDA1 family)